MKTIIFSAVILVLISCDKPSFDFNFGSTNLNTVYSWGTYYITGDSSNTIKAKITADDRTDSFSVASPGTRFSEVQWVKSKKRIINKYKGC